MTNWGNVFIMAIVFIVMIALDAFLDLEVKHYAILCYSGIIVLVMKGATNET
jgi:hypothetical protein